MNEYFIYIILSTAIFLLFPIFLRINLYFDEEQKKLYYGLRLYGVLKIYGGYLTLSKEGLIVHLTDKKATIIPYNQLNDEKKRFQITKGFQLLNYSQTTETSNDYTLAGVLFDSFLQILSTQYLAILKNKKHFIKFKTRTLINNRTESGRKISVCLQTVFNLLVIIVAFSKLLTEKLLNYGKKIREKNYD